MGSLLGQMPDSLAYLEQDTLPPVQRKGLFNFVFNRSFLLISDFRTDVPLNSAQSGTSSIGISFNKAFSPKWGFHFQPTFKTLGLAFRNTMERSFPNDPDTTLAMQKYRMYYFATDNGLRYNFKRDEKNRPVIFVEIGISLGFLVGNSEKKTKYFPKEKIKTKSSTIQDLNRWYSAVYLKANYRWLGLYANYRLTHIFLKSRTYRFDLNDNRPYPIFPNVEFGFCIVI